MFGFKQGTELGYWEVFFLSSGLAVITMACILSNLDMEADPRTRTFAAITESVPLALLIVRSSCLKYLSSSSMAELNHSAGPSFLNILSFRHPISSQPLLPRSKRISFGLCSFIQGTWSKRRFTKMYIYCQTHNLNLYIVFRLASKTFSWQTSSLARFDIKPL